MASGTPADRATKPRRAVRALGRALVATGSALAHVGRLVGRKASAAYHAVDPDVRRHLAQVPLLGYSLFGARSDPIEPGRADGHLPLLFVHGLGGSRGDFLLMSAFLRLHGRRRRYRIQLDAAETIEQHAARLAGFVDRVLAATGEAQVEIVAHSLGGLVVRLALVEHALAPKVATLVTLGTPHGGTYSARFADTAVTRSLRPDSPLLRRLGERRWPASVHGVTFWSASDVMILPAESAALAGTLQVEVTPFTHYSYLVDPRSWDLVRQHLERAEDARTAGGRTGDRAGAPR